MSTILSLIDIINETQSFWDVLPPKPLFHAAISQFVTKRVRFSQSRLIRRKMYVLLGDPYDVNILRNNITDNDLKAIGLSSDQIVSIREIANLPDPLTLESLSTIRGVGPWVLKSTQLLTETDQENIYLEEDFWIRSRLGECFNLNKVPTICQARKLLLNNVDSSGLSSSGSKITRFLWRIKPSGTLKIAKYGHNAKLNKDDFIDAPRS